MLRSQRQARRPQQRTDSTPHDRGIFKDRAHLPCAIAGFAAYLHNEYSQPSVFLAPAKLGRVPSEPTFEIEARPRRRRPRATRTQCACAPRSRAALHVAPHSGGTRLCIHSNGTLHLIHLTQRGHLAYAPLHTPQLRNYPRLPHYAGTLTLRHRTPRATAPNPPGRGATRPVRSALSAAAPPPHRHREAPLDAAKPQMTPRSFVEVHFIATYIVARTCEAQRTRVGYAIFLCAAKGGEGPDDQSAPCHRRPCTPLSRGVCKSQTNDAWDRYKGRARDRRPCPGHPGPRAACLINVLHILTRPQRTLAGR